MRRWASRGRLIRGGGRFELAMLKRDTVLRISIAERVISHVCTLWMYECNGFFWNDCASAVLGSGISLWLHLRSMKMMAVQRYSKKRKGKKRPGS